jgi:hypothetical protein
MDADGHEAAEGEICFYGGSERPAGLTAGTLAPQRFQSRCAAIDLDRLSIHIGLFPLHCIRRFPILSRR